ncbi:hypothetical protein Ahy_A09g043616 [Arachis hypogaea]|uniref:PB1 domain-containing protein n=1 Tax=Arachis hypogaea TaxID=3818 RepID=A0A445BIS9_ARAHY|nr:hypothetical protein Ahy_A09g043616 [Arachis hypogaea]
MASDESFVVLVHYRGSIKKKTRSGIKFTNKDLLSIFLKPSTSFAEFKSTILQTLGLQGVKRVEKLFYRIPVFVLRDDVKYDSFVISSDKDFQVLFHCRTCSSTMPVGSSSTVPVIAPEPDLVASPSFAVNLNRSCNALVGEVDHWGRLLLRRPVLLRWFRFSERLEHPMGLRMHCMMMMMMMMWSLPRLLMIATMGHHGRLQLWVGEHLVQLWTWMPWHLRGIPVYLLASGQETRKMLEVYLNFRSVNSFKIKRKSYLA